MNRYVAALIALLTLGPICPVRASDVLARGKLIKNEPMSYVQDECSDDAICLHRWWVAIIDVKKTLQGPLLSGRVTAAVLQHTAMNDHYKKAVRFFALNRIEDPGMRKKLRADYYLESASIDPPASQR